MAKNDTILLDGIIDNRVELKIPSNKRDEAFEYLAFEQVLKDYDLSNEEISYGSVDGRDDGGIDGFFIFINGHLLTEPESFNWPKSGCTLEVWVITCKHHDTFKQAPLDKLVASISELFELSFCNEKLRGDYSDLILKCRDNLKYAYRKVSPRLSSFELNYIYASRGNTSDIGDSIKSRSTQITAISEEFFKPCNVHFGFIGSSELVHLQRQTPNFCLELPFSEILASGERYVLLAKLKDYFGFISDNGKLRRYLFDSNIRDFMGLNRVNEDIRNTLEDDNSPDFWWLNNGVTILATSASVVGGIMQLQDIQIVNGLQTTESVYRYFESGGFDTNSRSILIKIIVSQDSSARDTIIRATNNQTHVELTSLHATDKIQRDIEDILEHNDFYYERRKNSHQNLGHPPALTITPIYLASGFISLVIKSPSKATNLKPRFMRSQESYDTVFSEKTPISIWPKIAIILKLTDITLNELRPLKSHNADSFLAKWRPLVSLITISRLLGKFDFNTVELSRFNTDSYTPHEIELTWEVISSNIEPNALTKGALNRRFVQKLCAQYTESLSITGADRVELENAFPNFSSSKLTSREKQHIDVDFVNKVNALLPDQPWRKGVHKGVRSELGCTGREYSIAVSWLIEEGLRYRQTNGVLFDLKGREVILDAKSAKS